MVVVVGKGRVVRVYRYSTTGKSCSGVLTYSHCTYSQGKCYRRDTHGC